ncbi:MAG: hypothetical protein JEZ11_08690 [Desulfobacterales bacterium]|nr:hypothetical protein [Desulfobacterales bacterium]
MEKVKGFVQHYSEMPVTGGKTRSFHLATFQSKFAFINRMAAAVTRIERARRFLEATQFSVDCMQWMQERGQD